MSHSREPKKLDTSYSETTSLFGLKLWLQGVLMRAPCCQSFRSNSLEQGVPKKMSHSWEHKKLGTSYSETTHLLGLRLWLQGVLMRALCCRRFRSNRCLVSEYEVPNVLGSQKWDIFSETPCRILARGEYFVFVADKHRGRITEIGVGLGKNY